MEEHLNSKAVMLSGKLGSRSLQPHAVVISTTGTPFSESPAYVVLGPSLYYRVGSVLQAVDAVLKAAFVLDVDYPAPSRSCWTFLQRAVFGINTAEDIISTRLQELLVDLEVNG